MLGSVGFLLTVVCKGSILEMNYIHYPLLKLSFRMPEKICSHCIVSSSVCSVLYTIRLTSYLQHG